MATYKIWGGNRRTTRMIINRLKECGISIFLNAIVLLEGKKNYVLFLIPNGFMWSVWLSACPLGVYNAHNSVELLYNQITPEYLQRLLNNAKGI